MADRVYFHVPKRPYRAKHAWHGLDENVSRRDVRWFVGLCGSVAGDTEEYRIEEADRVPAKGHLCGRCGRVIAAQTDVEAPGPYTGTPI